jgi:hypothetical protein
MSMIPEHTEHHAADSDTAWDKADLHPNSTVESEAEARGGYLNSRLLWVLVLSMLATLIAFVCIWAFWTP